MKRLNTKQARLDLLNYQFNQLIERGFSREEYKDINIFTAFEGGKYLLKVFRGTATNPTLYYSYRNAENMNDTVIRCKQNADNRETYKAERKKTTGRLTGAAACADAIRKELKEKFHGFKFSVTSETFSGGDSVRIHWMDGPTVEEVEAITGKYQQGHFDGMTDMYEYSNNREDIPQAKYISESREMSEDNRKKLHELCAPIFEKESFGFLDVSNMAYRLFYQASFPKNAEIKGIEKTGKTSGLCDVSVFYKITFEVHTPEPEKTDDVYNWDDLLREVEETNGKKQLYNTCFAQNAPEKTEEIKQNSACDVKNYLFPDAGNMIEPENTAKNDRINAYRQKKEDRAARLRDRARKARKESTSAYNQAKQIGDMIPFGQPILVGHHSEGRHRRDIERINSGMRKSIDLDEKAKYYEEKADRIENNRVISSDDPEAIDKLKEKLIGLEQCQQLMKSCNSIIREKTTLRAEKVEKMVQLGVEQKDAENLLTPNCMGNIGFASYSLSNNMQNISSVKKRIEQLEKRLNQEETKEEINGVRIVDNTVANRIQIFFNSIPDEQTRSKLKKSGFRWTPSQKCWQSYRNQWNKDRAKIIAEAMELAEV